MESEYTSVSRLRFHPRRRGMGGGRSWPAGRLQHHRDSGFQVSVTRCLFSLFPVPGYLRPRAIPPPPLLLRPAASILLSFTSRCPSLRAIFQHRFLLVFHPTSSLYIYLVILGWQLSNCGFQLKLTTT